jgi:hypothetical protein
MPQARTSGSSTSKQAAKRAPARSMAAAKGRASATKPATAKKPAAAKRAATSKAAATKPGATSRTAASAKAGNAKTSGARSSASKPSASASKASASRASTSKASGSKANGSKTKPRITIRVTAEGKEFEAIAERLRKLNERIIDVGREAGESTLTSYERALKTIASGIGQRPAKDEFEWITHLATSQAKFVREITDSWAKAARDRLK